MSALCLLLAVVAFALFGLATPDHHRAWLGQTASPARARAMRAVGWAMIAAAFPFAMLAQGWVFGPILWVGSVMLGAGIVFLTLNFVPVRGAGK